MLYSVSTDKPPNFKADLDVTGCFCEYQNTILYLRNSPNKTYPGLWGIPGGKSDPHETPLESILREVHEETNLILDPATLQPLIKLYVKGIYSFHFYLFRTTFDARPEIKLKSNENDEYQWLSLADIQKLPLLPAGHDILNIYKKIMGIS